MAKAKKIGPERKRALKAKTTKKKALEVLGGVLARTGLSLRECTVLRQCCDARLAQIAQTALADAGARPTGPGPLLRAGRVNEVKDLFRKLTGHPLDTE